jgi:hypothetical protein
MWARGYAAGYVAGHNDGHMTLYGEAFAEGLKFGLLKADDYRSKTKEVPKEDSDGHWPPRKENV